MSNINRRPEPNSGFRRPRENRRFGVNKGKYSKHNLVIDEQIQEATPEHMRIEIDKIIDDFIGDPEKSEYIFPAGLNNLQRKYIHYKAHRMNLISRSFGQEPNRQLHLKKKQKRNEMHLFQLELSDESVKELHNFEKIYGTFRTRLSKTKMANVPNKSYTRLLNFEPSIPTIVQLKADVLEHRANLPIYDKRQMILDTINNNQVTIIAAETGSGKTTQIPQYIMEDANDKKEKCKIICTQPRRISTLAVAERVAYERSEHVGSSVGYHIRLESKYGSNTTLLYCTAGIFLRCLMGGSEELKNITHVIVDEIHERDKLSDFLLICLRENLSRFPNLRIIITSATVNIEKFQEYFNTNAVLSIPGNLHPVKSYFLEDILVLTKYFSPLMKDAMVKLKDKEESAGNVKQILPDDDQENLNSTLEAYLEMSSGTEISQFQYHQSSADLLQLFVSENVPVDQTHSGNGRTALMLACYVGDLEFVERLHAMGARTNIMDNAGKTAYDYAVLGQRDDVIQYLNNVEQSSSNEQNLNDPDYLTRLYDMTTPDDFIDYDLIVTVIIYILNNSDFGSILIFLPGYDEIMQCNDYILNSPIDHSSYRTFFLHSSMNMRDQCDVFKPSNVRKIIISTNIAETSITIADVVFVIDIGKAKEKVFDSYNNVSVFQTQWISRSCVKQRTGRAGRTKPGFVFRLYSERRYIHMLPEKIPEILKVSLEELCLNAKIIAPVSMEIENFLSLAPDPPGATSITAAIENLVALGALDENEHLTKLGEYLAQFPVEPRLGKMLLLGIIFGCLEPILTLTAALSHKDPFQLPSQSLMKGTAGAKRRELADDVFSDHYILLNAFQKWQDKANTNFCSEYFISESTMHSIVDTRRQLLAQLRALGFIDSAHSLDQYNSNSNSWPLVKAVMSAAYFPNVAYPSANGIVLNTKNEKKVMVHPTSICNKSRLNNWCYFDEIFKTRNKFTLKCVTHFIPLTIAMVCGVEVSFTSDDIISIDNWLEFQFTNKSLKNLRTAINVLIEKALTTPFMCTNDTFKAIPTALRRILDIEEEACGLSQPKNIGKRPKFFHVPNKFSKKPHVDEDWRQIKYRRDAGPNGAITRAPVKQWNQTYKNFSTNNRQRNFNSSQNPHCSSEGTSSTHTEYNLRPEPPCASSLDPATRMFNGLQIATSNKLNHRTGVNAIHYPDQRQHHGVTEYSCDSGKDNFMSSLSSPSSDFTEPTCHDSNGETVFTSPFNYCINANNENSYDSTYYSNIENDCQLLQTAINIYNETTRNNNSDNNNNDNGVKNNNISIKEIPTLKCNRYDSIYLLIKANQKRNIHISQASNRWVFSPQTEKKILRYYAANIAIYLVFFVKEIRTFMGIAEFQNMSISSNTRPTATISWIYKSVVNRLKIEYLCNSCDGGKPLVDCEDGSTIGAAAVNALLKIYQHLESKE